MNLPCSRRSITGEQARNLDMILITISPPSAPPAPPLPPRHPCSPCSHPVFQAFSDTAFWSWLPLSPLPHPPTLSSWMDNYSSCRPPMRHNFFQEALPVSTSVLAHRWGCMALQKAVLTSWLCPVHNLSNPPWMPRPPQCLTLLPCYSPHCTVIPKHGLLLVYKLM